MKIKFIRLFQKQNDKMKPKTISSTNILRHENHKYQVYWTSIDNINLPATISKHIPYIVSMSHCEKQIATTYQHTAGKASIKVETSTISEMVTVTSDSELFSLYKLLNNNFTLNTLLPHQAVARKTWTCKHTHEISVTPNCVLLHISIRAFIYIYIYNSDFRLEKFTLAYYERF